jgi:hypothetical protein
MRSCQAALAHEAARNEHRITSERNLTPVDVIILNAMATASPQLRALRQKNRSRNNPT